MANDLLPWIGLNFGVAHHAGDGGRLAFPGVATATTVQRCSRLKFRAVGSASNPLLVEADLSANTGLPVVNDGWNFARFGFAGVQINEEPTGRRDLPDWDPTSSKIRDRYTEWQRDLHIHIVPKGNEVVDPGLLLRRRRLVGVAPFLAADGKTVFWDLVQIFRVRDALINPGPDNTLDWVAYKISPLPGNPIHVQEGGGHGPPDLK